MIETIFLRTHCRYTQLPLLGALVDDFATWLSERGHGPGTIRVMLGQIDQLDTWLRERGAHTIADLDHGALEAGWAHFYRRGGTGSNLGAAIRALARYLETKGILQPPSRLPQTPSEQLIAAYGDHLLNLRGLAPSTITEHQHSASCFLEYIGYDSNPEGLHELTVAEVESFVRTSSQQLGRGTQQHRIGYLRSLLRFLAARDQCPAGLDTTLDTPRLYRGEQLPRALPWNTVQSLLESIDRSTTVGLRDYTMLLLIATYGLRVSEVAALRLDDIHWRDGWLQVPQCKTRDAPPLPLIDGVGAALVEYLRQARPNAVACRALFLRVRVPIRALKPNAVSMVFDRWAKRSGLSISFSGAHCIRHAYALNLLRTGASLKTIGDLLGHRDTDSTYRYLRLATEELREVALPVPRLSDHASSPERSP